MDEGKLKEDDWLKEINSSIGKQIEESKKQEPSEGKKDNILSDALERDGINQNKNKDENVADNKKKQSSPEKDSLIRDVDGKEQKAEENRELEAASLEREEAQQEDTAEERKIEEELGNLDWNTDTSNENAGALQDYLKEAQENSTGKKKWSWKKKLLLTLGIFLFLIGGVFATGYFMLEQIKTEKPSDIKRAETDLTEEELAAQEAALVPKVFDDTIEQKVVNILLIGEEAMDDDLGRSDSIMIATLNTVEKSIKLTSLMRDIYVTIPGYADNKLNAAYHNGGGVLLAETIEQNFGIGIDGYVRVDFSAFETIVNELGGVQISLTSEEAHYLNTTNYISNKAYRNVSEGLQTLNGNQALGYCRVRYRTASNGDANDFGRTYRQRTVLKAIFDKYKSQNVVNMVSIATELLSYVTTNLTKTDIVSYITTAASFGTMELETFRIPADNTYYGDKINKKSVLVINFEENNRALRNFIYAKIDDADIKVESGDMEDDKYFSYLWTD